MTHTSGAINFKHHAISRNGTVIKLHFKGKTEQIWSDYISPHEDRKTWDKAAKKLFERGIELGRELERN